MKNKKIEIDNNHVKHPIFVGVRLSKDQDNWLIKQAYKKKTDKSKIIRKILNDRIDTENMQKELGKLNINIKQINKIELLEEK